jgi:perosamine synthetase
MSRFDEKDLQNLKNVLDTDFKAKKSKKCVKEFEDKFAEKFNSKYGISCCNGTATLHGILIGMGIKEDDEVITTPLTMSSTSLCVLHANALPVFADVDPDTFQILPESIESKITSRTKAIITVALYGLSPEMDKIMEIAKKHNLYVIEDNAQCFLGEFKGQILGSIGHASSFSFQNTKHMTTGEGGMILTNDIQLQDNICKATILGYQTVGELSPKFDNRQFRDPAFKRHVAFGYNYRMSELCCAVGLSQLEKLDYLVNKRIEIANKFNDLLKETNCDWLVPQKVNDYIKNTYWGFTVKLTRDDISFVDFRDKLMEYGGKAPYAAWELTYLEPLFENKKIKDYQWQEFNKGLCPNAEYLQSRIISFQNNYLDSETLEKQLEALKKTIFFFQKKIIAVIFCRLGSSRLPNKGLLKLNKVSSIERVILNVKKMIVDDIILATSINSENIKLKKYADKHNIKFLQGSEHNIFDRCNDVIKKLKLKPHDYILRVGADDVCRSYEIANILIRETKKSNQLLDYICDNPYICPTGLGSELLSVKSINYFNSFLKENNEHLTFYYVAFRKKLKLKSININEKYKLDCNITMDTIEDYNNLNKFFIENEIGETAVDIEKVLEYFSVNNKKESALCIGDSPDETIKNLNNQCKNYSGYKECYNVYGILNQL